MCVHACTCVFVCGMYMCICAYMCLCVHMCALCAYVFVCGTCMCTCLFACVYISVLYVICLHACAHVFACAYMYIYMHMCLCACVCVYVRVVCVCLLHRGNWKGHQVLLLSPPSTPCPPLTWRWKLFCLGARDWNPGLHACIARAHMHGATSSASNGLF